MTRGGVDVYVRSLAGALRAAGHRPEIVIDLRSTTSLARGMPEDPAVPVHGIRMQARLHPTDAITADLDALLEARSPDEIHVVCGVPWACLPLRELAVRR